MIFFASCQQKNEFENKEVTLEDIGFSIAKSIAKSQSLRESIAIGISKRFDYEPDVLLFELSNNVYEGNSFYELLAENFPYEVSPETVEAGIKSFHYLQLSIPDILGDWNYKTELIPLVVVPSNIEDTDSIDLKTFDSNGNYKFINSKTPPENCVLVLSESERIDRKGRLVVDSDGIVLPENKRLPYSEASLKSSNIDNHEEMIVVYSGKEEFALLEKQFGLDKFEKFDVEDSICQKNYVMQKSALVDISLTGRANNPKTMDIEWNSVGNATSYDIYQSGYRNLNGTKTYVGDYKIFTLTGTTTTTKSFSVDYANEEYTFYVVPKAGTVALERTNKLTIHSSGRKNNGEEYVRRVFLERSFIRSIEGWYANHVEILPTVKYCNAEGRFTEEKINMLKVDIDNIPVIGIQDTQVDCVWSLFNWDRSSSGFGSYIMNFEEYDGDDNDKKTIDYVFDLVKFVASEIGAQKYYTEIIEPLPDVIEELKRGESMGGMKVKWWDPNSMVKTPKAGFTIYLEHNINNN